MNYWCESCARKNWCYVVDVRPKCFVPITNTAKVEWYPYSNGELLFKDDPNSSEKPNNCDTCKYGEDKHRYAHICNECGVGINNYEPKTFPTISKMEQVEDETRLTAKCLNCANGSSYKCSKCDGEMYYKYDKDEPQTEREGE